MPPLKVVHVSASNYGGAGRAASRLHEGLRRLGCESTMLVASIQGCSPDIQHYQAPMSLIERFSRRIRNNLQRKAFRAYQATRPKGLELFSSDQSQFGAGVVAALRSHLGIVNLHYVAGFVDYKKFFLEVPQRTPVVWTLHDMNPFTGGCHYDAGCKAYASGCGLCPQLGSNTRHDLAYAIFQRKRSALSRVPVSNFRIVSPSRWLAEEARKSILFHEFEVDVIPLGVDVKTFQPRDKSSAREALGLKRDAKVVLFVADNRGHGRKGFDLLQSALGSLVDRRDLLLITVGNGINTASAEFSQFHFGHVDSDALLTAIYSAADVFVIPSRQENFAQTALEALACGTPVVASRVGGMPEIVRPGVTGLLAEPENVGDLCDCLAKLLADSRLQAKMAKNCRRIAKEEYSIELQAERYLDIYNSLINETS
jgi:glycosyltransferase involved in cell wall biosynthesis